MLNFLQEKLFNAEKFGCFKDEEIVDYMANFSIIIEQIARELRNPSAHNKIMKSYEAELMIDWVLFGQKILPTFLGKIK